MGAGGAGEGESRKDEEHNVGLKGESVDTNGGGGGGGGGWCEFSQSFLRRVLEAEEVARLSPQQQVLYEAAEAEGAPHGWGWMEETDALQRRLLRAEGVPLGREADALRALRAAPHAFPSLRRIPLYHRHNRARAGALRAGDDAPDAALFRLSDGARTSVLIKAASSPLPMIVAAGVRLAHACTCIRRKRGTLSFPLKPSETLSYALIRFQTLSHPPPPPRSRIPDPRCAACPFISCPSSASTRAESPSASCTSPKRTQRTSGPSPPGGATATGGR